jgi:hypothetical protein
MGELTSPRCGTESPDEPGARERVVRRTQRSLAKEASLARPRNAVHPRDFGLLAARLREEARKRRPSKVLPTCVAAGRRKLPDGVGLGRLVATHRVEGATLAGSVRSNGRSCERG